MMKKTPLSPSPFHIPLDRRRLLQSLLITSGGIITSDIYAEALTLTPRQTEGPYYPDHLPLDQDNDLSQIAGESMAAEGDITEFGGRLLDLNGKPITDGVVELWQSDNNGCYLHSRGKLKGEERDPGFQGYGKIKTNEKGEYRFRTIKPGLYTGRTRHFHVAVLQNDKRMLTTQLYFLDEPGNKKDGILNRIKDADQKMSVLADFKVSKENKKIQKATWDIVIGLTPEDPKPKGNRGGQPTKGKGPKGARQN